MPSQLLHGDSTYRASVNKGSFTLRWLERTITSETRWTSYTQMFDELRRNHHQLFERYSPRRNVKWEVIEFQVQLVCFDHLQRTVRLQILQASVETFTWKNQIAVEIRCQRKYRGREDEVGKYVDLHAIQTVQYVIDIRKLRLMTFRKWKGLKQATNTFSMI